MEQLKFGPSPHPILSREPLTFLKVSLLTSRENCTHTRTQVVAADMPCHRARKSSRTNCQQRDPAVHTSQLGNWLPYPRVLGTVIIESRSTIEKDPQCAYEPLRLALVQRWSRTWSFSCLHIYMHVTYYELRYAACVRCRRAPAKQ